MYTPSEKEPQKVIKLFSRPSITFAFTWLTSLLAARKELLALASAAWIKNMREVESTCDVYCRVFIRSWLSNNDCITQGVSGEVKNATSEWQCKIWPWSAHHCIPDFRWESAKHRRLKGVERFSLWRNLAPHSWPSKGYGLQGSEVIFGRESEFLLFRSHQNWSEDGNEAFTA